MRKLTVLAAVGGWLMFAVPAMAADSPVAGTWATEAKSDFGTFKSTWTVSDMDGMWSVAVADAPMAGGPGGGDGGAPPPPPKSTISDVMVDGNTLTFKRELVMNDMTIDLSYKVTVDGDAMTGTSHSDFGDIPITGARQ
jgi:hypothetical protein